MKDLSIVKYYFDKPYIPIKDNRYSSGIRRVYGDMKKCSLCDSEYFRPHSNKGSYCSRPCASKSLIGKFRYEKSSKFKGGRNKHPDGYIVIKDYKHPNRDKQNRVLEHRVVMEKKIGRYLKSTEHVHHINGIVDDNRPENLMLFSSNSEHKKFHKGELWRLTR